ncbi:VTT domain-containing protein [Tuwongella immobilis]|uniref:VTT domain-containing protein n=1 Tax=Tuwongella immobilis TaxID=692036 RepID=A0A6C2YJZ1_9BACT|nr:VTT domain-containing protein [Tuwongella immobilis]VIP01694.1 Hypothetical membrane protein OS=Gemmatimonas aurantiaca (strain T-27 / DSM 14586 / JCM 11422 / NBRC 100505) GN=GAU_2047 PE=4 SV=1: SNARE_assoc [Tuwongella immobilis]VTR99170.1 Hypothetical membrane protein OS=Gemmatimonas aurantiaca (strain T-27 / DSM 14586 / JCM 11422 / NBRC 100505) GN=GAU_2047 PE=4 SV=1: SNARE_assoc [Tuwongella immobilis]
MEELLSQIRDVFLNLFNTPALMETLGKPEITVAAFIALAIIIFTETGLLIGFFLPGDSLLVTVGIVAWGSGWNVPLLLVILSVAAIVGDSVGYAIGRRAGPRLFQRPESFFFRPKYLEMAQAFYEKHGGKTIILARFVPIVRTFAPVVAGIGKMDYRRFVLFNIVGGIGWVVSMILVGYLITPVLQAPLQRVFGADFQIQKHLEKVILLVIFLSILPGLIPVAKSYLASKRRPVGTPELPPVTATGKPEENQV